MSTCPRVHVSLTRPRGRISGRLDSVLCSISAPLTGHITIDDCSATIKSIELQAMMTT